jgi:hypothetical protein
MTLSPNAIASAGPPGDGGAVHPAASLPVQLPAIRRIA